MKTNHLNLTSLLIITVFFDAVLLLYRNIHLTGYWAEADSLNSLLTGEQGVSFLFLGWNLFLAWIPYGISLILREQQTQPIKLLLLAGWLLFFPNAPYIITDLLHLRERPPVPLWYDMLTIFSFAWTGLIFGYLSLIRIQRIIIREWGHLAGQLLTAGALLLAGLDVYIGRFLRWNSWDILTRPHHLLADLATIFTDPTTHWPAMGLGILSSVLLLLGYSTLRAIRL